MTPEKKIFEFFFSENLTFRLPLRFGQNSYGLNKIVITLNLHFSHCKSMETFKKKKKKKKKQKKKTVCFVKDHSRNISVKLLSKYLQ